MKYGKVKSQIGSIINYNTYAYAWIKLYIYILDGPITKYNVKWLQYISEFNNVIDALLILSLDNTGATWPCHTHS